MIRSMTGFARSETHTPQGQLLWELRSVNHRYLETQIRLPEGFRAIEADARQAIARSVRRGKLDAGLILRPSGDRQLNAVLNPGYARELLAHARKLSRRYANTAYGNASQDFVPTDFSSSAELLQTILNEEYLALMHTIEVFNFVRRINYQIAYRDTTGQTVVLKPTNGDQFPQRFLYSVDESTVNPNMPTQTVADLFKPTTANSP